MATSGSDEDRTRFFRLSLIIIDELTQILRDLLHNEVPPSQLFHKVINIDHLKKTLRRDQIYIISNAKTHGYKDFDITLLYTLLRNVCQSSIQPPSQKWGLSEMPSKNEITVGDDIERIRLCRNKLFGHISEAAIPETEFQEYWSIITDICTRLQTLLKKDYVKKLRDAKERSIDADTDNKFIELIKRLTMKDNPIRELTSKETIKIEPRVAEKAQIVQTLIDTSISILTEMVGAVNEMTSESDIHQIYASLIEFIKYSKEDHLHLHLKRLLNTLQEKICSYAKLQGQNQIIILTNFLKLNLEMMKEYDAQVDYIRSSILLLVTFSSMRGYDLYKQDLENGRIGERILELFLYPPFLHSFGLNKDDIEIYLNGSLLTQNKETLRQFQPNMAHSNLGKREFRFVQRKGHIRFQEISGPRNVNTVPSVDSKEFHGATQKYNAMDLPTRSKSVYAALCRRIGTSDQVDNRRDIVDISVKMNNKLSSIGRRGLDIGSRREGFRLEESDMDHMIWHSHHRVFWDFSQIDYTKAVRQTIILSKTSESPPGYALLWLPFERRSRNAESVCVRINGLLCISSARYRKKMLSLICSNSTENDPCCRGNHGPLGYDHAHGFFCGFWPPSASSWIERCHSWPPTDVLNEITQYGCHFVAIGNKAGNHVDNEWRISFSHAELKLVYSMNRTQFLTYGLLKLFLTESINKELEEDEKVLSSYHMKTAIFWAIQQNIISDWCPQNLLTCFWVCFKILIKWVYEGCCPNFFIPENNMFLNKVHGSTQHSLFGRLLDFYEKGQEIVFEFPSIISNYIPTYRIDEQTLLSEAMFDAKLFEEIYTHEDFIEDLYGFDKQMNVIGQLLKESLSQVQILMLRRNAVSILQKAAFMLHDVSSKISGVNKNRYFADKISCNMLKLGVRFGCVSDWLYLGMYYYKTNRYREALSVVGITKAKLSEPFLMYYWDVNEDEYIRAVRGKSYFEKTKCAVALIIGLQEKIRYIDEFKLNEVSIISPYVLNLMLEVLCCIQIDRTRAIAVKTELQSFVENDNERIRHKELRESARKILAICENRL
ncbi:uncharacterized protein LOC111120402 isoform X2 [Crassostrea virginica]